MRKLILSAIALCLICLSCDNTVSEKPRGEVSMTYSTKVEILVDGDSTAKREIIHIKEDSLTVISTIKAGTNGRLIISVEPLIKESNSSNKCVVKDKYSVLFSVDKYGEIKLSSLTKEDSLLEIGIDNVRPSTKVLIHPNNEIAIKSLFNYLDKDIMKSCSKGIAIRMNAKDFFQKDSPLMIDANNFDDLSTEFVQLKMAESNVILQKRKRKVQFSEIELGEIGGWWARTYDKFDRHVLEDALVDGKYEFIVYVYTDEEGQETQGVARAIAAINFLKPKVLDSKNHPDNFKIGTWKERAALGEDSKYTEKIIVKFVMEEK